MTEPDPVFPAEAPSPASMQLDLGGLTGSGHPILSGPCHTTSVVLVGLASAVLVVSLSIPVAVLAVTVDSEPVYIGDQTWRWSGSGGSGSLAWTSEFDGHVVDLDTVTWTMQVSGTALGLKDFTWYTGVSNVSADTGSWKFFDPTDLSEIEETLFSTYADISETSGTLIFENRNDDGAGFGDVLTYLVAGDDLSVSFFSAQEDATARVEWNRTTGEGMQTNLAGETCCWGESPEYDDVPCP